METIHVYPTKAQEKVVVAFLQSLKIPFEKPESLPAHVLAGIQKGKDDVEAGRTMTFEEFQKRKL
jgi:hypothetical protein